MAEEKRAVELALQMDKSGRPPGNDKHDSPSIEDNFRSFFSLPAAKRRYRRLGNDEADGQQPKITGGLKTMPFIIGNETCEKLAVVGVQGNMMVYLTTKYNMKKVAATSMLNAWSGTMGLATLPGAFLADSYIGRFGMITIGCFSYVLAMFILTLTAVIPGFSPSSCSATDKKLSKCESASAGQFALLVLFFIFMAGGSAGTRPSVMAFGADQFAQGGEREKRRLQSYFNWYYFAGRVAVIIALTFVVYIQSDVSWGFGFSLCTAFMLTSSISFLLGAPNYRHEIPQGSALTGFAQVILASVKNRNLPLPPDSLHLHHEQSSCDKPCLTNQFRFLNKAAIMTPGHTPPIDSWRVCSVEKIEGLKSVIRTLPIFSCGIANQITNAQQHTFPVLQAQSMDRRIGSKGFKIPAGSFSVFSLFVLIAWLPFYDRVVVPYARRNTRNNRGITVFQRLGIGFAISSLSMLVAGLVEVKRRTTARSHGLTDQPSAVVPISALWLLPQFCIYGLAEAFYAVGHLEFFYEQFPATMRSTAIAMSWCMTALGNYLSAVIVNVIHNTTGRDGKPDWLDDNLNRGHLEYFYWLLSGLEALNLVYFIICTGTYKHRDPFTAAETKPDACTGCHGIEFECIQE
uniref:NPF family transporter n=1 Tax=Pinus pinaster TaxID=71647 RepID=A0A1S6YCP8_PINPS|nr:NPF family transporter [Pinus pinaster]